MNQKFISQFGTETSSMRPKGTNPHDDFNSIAKETTTALSTLTINHRGAIKQRICSNCHLEETSMREKFADTNKETHYLLGVKNPENPILKRSRGRDDLFQMTLTMETVETPRTCFNYLKKSNRTLNRDDKKEEEESEKSHNEASKVVNFVDPTIMVDYHTTSSVISSHPSSIIKYERQGIQLTEEESKMVDDRTNKTYVIRSEIFCSVKLLKSQDLVIRELADNFSFAAALRKAAKDEMRPCEDASPNRRLASRQVVNLMIVSKAFEENKFS
ncbi:hypothetical protein JTB14_023014 [Gonioctena quinquepunctata]|nr:hypothetical protein JTB14_023014 [Gonioctena quinquepunctata]